MGGSEESGLGLVIAAVLSGFNHGSYRLQRREHVDVALRVRGRSSRGSGQLLVRAALGGLLLAGREGGLGLDIEHLTKDTKLGLDVVDGGCCGQEKRRSVHVERVALICGVSLSSAV